MNFDSTRLWVFVLLSFGLNCQLFGQAAATDSKHRKIDKAELTSIVSCTVQMLKGLTAGDVLIAKETTFDSVKTGVDELPRGVLGRNNLVSRVCFDDKSNRYAHHSRQSQDVTILPSGVEQKQLLYSGFSYAGEGSLVFSWFDDKLSVDRPEKLSKSIEGILTGKGFPDPRSLPLYGELGPLQGELKEETMPSGRNIVENVKFAALIDGKAVITCLFKNSGVPGYHTIINEEYSLDSLMRTYKSIKLRNVDTKEEIPFKTIRVTWKEFDGLQVPTLVSLEKRSRIQIGKNLVKGTEQTVFRLQWLSVNKPISEDKFDGTSVSSIETIREKIEVESGTSRQIFSGNGETDR